MHDRNPRYPGRVKMTPVPGEVDTYDMEMADGATEEGTPWAKGFVLSDSTALSLGLDPADDPSVDDAFRGIYRVGDIRRTTEPLDDPNWIPNDGRKIDRAEYPDLVGIPQIFTGNWDVQDLGGMLLGLEYMDGYWYRLVQGNNYVEYTATPDNPASWARGATIPNIDITGGAVMAAGNGYLAVICVVYNSGWSENGTYVQYATNPRTGTMSVGYSARTSSLSGVGSAIKYTGGYWIIYGNTKLYYRQNNPAGSFTALSGNYRNAIFTQYGEQPCWTLAGSKGMSLYYSLGVEFDSAVTKIEVKAGYFSGVVAGPDSMVQESSTGNIILGLYSSTSVNNTRIAIFGWDEAAQQMISLESIWLDEMYRGNYDGEYLLYQGLTGGKPDAYVAEGTLGNGTFVKVRNPKTSPAAIDAKIANGFVIGRYVLASTQVQCVPDDQSPDYYSYTKGR